MDKEMLIAIITAVSEIVIYFCAKYLAPEIFDDVQFVLQIVLALVLMIIGKLLVDKVVAQIRALRQ